ncbi:MAG: hypothetical protein EAZ15_00780 [Sphingobacteriales bacterium]|nr:MAG: hypothetical protein EAZ15_00780 [Sphingobacteriales bacterium]
MPHTQCLVAPAFSIVGTQQIINQPANFSFEFDSVEDQALVLAYQWYVNGDFVINKNQPTFTEQMPVGTYTIGGRLLTDEGWSGVKTVFFEIVEQGSIPIGDFTFMAVYFRWLQGAGVDLDIKVVYENTGTSYDNIFVGYSGSDDTVPSNINTPEENAYLWWGSDSTGTAGTESVLIGVQKFIADNPLSLNIVEIALYATWFGAPNSGIFTVELKTYLNGTMAKNGTVFENTGGTAPFTNSKTITTLNNKPNYYKIGIIKYNKTSKLAQLQTL